MTRQLQSNWQFLLISSLRRSIWAANPESMAYEQELAVRLLEKGSFPQMSALPSEIDIFLAASNNEDPEDQTGKCAVVSIVGPMLRYGTICSYGADEYAAMLGEVERDNSITCVVLNVDSGGGDVRAVAPLLEAINSLKAVKPVVASVDFCASAAYWVASACDKVFAQNTIASSVGSIGTYSEFIDDSENLSERGYKKHTVYAAQSVDKNKEYRDAVKGEYSSIQNNILKPLNDSFINSITVNRPNVDTSVFTGKTYFASEAQSLGLIDGVKSLSEVISFAQELVLVRKFTNQ